MVTNNNYNMIGFNFPNRKYKWQDGEWVMPEPIYKTCVIHQGRILIPKKGEEGVLWCPECGTNYLEKDTASEEEIHSMFGPGGDKSAIISGKNRKKKYYDQQGNEVTDPEIILQMKLGKTVQYYHEEGGPTKEDKGKRQVKVVRK